MLKNLKHSIVFVIIAVMLLLVVVMSLAASKPLSINTATVNSQVENNLKYGKWPGLGMGIFSTGDTKTFDGYVDTLLANGFTELRIDIPDYQNTGLLAASKASVIRANAKGAKVIWGVSSNSLNNTSYIITAANWPAYRQAILNAAAWAQANGVYEFQLGNEAETHVDGTTLTRSQLIINLKSVATSAQAIFTNGNISYSCFHENISDWTAAGKGDIDILASNVYMEWGAHRAQPWKTEISNLVTAFGTEGTYLTEFGPSSSGLASYSTDEAVQAAGVAEMIDYFKVSGMTRALFYVYADDTFGVRYEHNGAYRLLWNTLTSGTNVNFFDKMRYYLNCLFKTVQSKYVYFLPQL